MAKKFDMGEFARSLQPVEPVAAATMGSPRSIEQITDDILRLQQDAGNAVIGIGLRLIEAKEMLPHGEWLPWLTEQVGYSEKSAQNYMRLARKCSNPQLVADLGVRKALTLLTLPAEEQEQFVAEPHIVNGEEKSVIDMTSRELERAIRERDEALRAAETAKAEARSAENSRAKMEADMAALKQLHESAQAAEEQARQALTAAQAELKAIQEKPVEVAVMAVDQDALDKARREAVAEMQAKVDKAVEARKRAEVKSKSAEESIAALRQQLEAAQRVEKQAAMAGDKDFAAFELLFSQTQENVNKLHGLLLKVRGRGDAALADKLKSALLALAAATKGCAE